MSQFEDKNFYSNSGGFMQGSPGGGSPGGAPRRGVGHALRPCTCQQLNEAVQAHSEAEWQIDGIDVGQVTIIGRVVTINRQTTNMIYTIEDTTGTFEARHWTDSAKEDVQDVWKSTKEEDMVRVMGSLKAFNNKRYLNATHIRPLHGPEEEEYHYLEVTFVNRIAKHGPPPKPGQDFKPNVNHNSDPSAYTAQSNSSASAAQFAELSPLKRKIVEYMKVHLVEDPNGASISAISKAIAGGHEASTISDTVDELLDEGLIYTTTNEFTYGLID